MKSCECILFMGFSWQKENLMQLLFYIYPISWGGIIYVVKSGVVIYFPKCWNGVIIKGTTWRFKSIHCCRKQKCFPDKLKRFKIIHVRYLLVKNDKTVLFKLQSFSSWLNWNLSGSIYRKWLWVKQHCHSNNDHEDLSSLQCLFHHVGDYIFFWFLPNPIFALKFYLCFDIQYVCHHRYFINGKEVFNCFHNCIKSNN